MGSEQEKNVFKEYTMSDNLLENNFDNISSTKKDSLQTEANLIKQESHNAYTICLMSGKGGVGKTGLSINIANFVSTFKKRVLLIDCDLSTNGATAFFRLNNTIREKIREDNLSFQKLMSFILNDISFNHVENQKEEIFYNMDNFFEGSIFEIKNDFSFIPAKLENEIFNEQELTDNRIHKIEERLEHIFALWRNSYDIIILDCGAGYNILNNLLKNYANRICLVMENSDISRIATRKSLEDLFSNIGIESITCCINMIKSSKTNYVRGGLIEEFIGFKYTEAYSKLYDNGEMIKIEDSNLCRQLIRVIENVYTEGYRLREQYDEYILKIKEQKVNDDKQKFNSFMKLFIIPLVLVCMLIFLYIFLYLNKLFN